MSNSTPFAHVQHHLSETTCKLEGGSESLIYERVFNRNLALKPTLLDSLATECARNKAELEHPNIINYDFCGDTDGQVTLRRQYVNGENLYFYISLADLPRPAAIAASLALAKIVEFVHSKGLACMSLTPSNVIIDSNGALNLVDCCVESIFYDNYHDRNTAIDILFLGPEGLNEDSLFPHRQSRDIWCLGLIIYFTFAGSYPWPVNNKMKVANSLVQDTLKLPNGLNSKLANLLSRMLDKNPAHRPDIKTVCQELESLEKDGTCCRLSTLVAQSTGQLPVFKKIQQSSRVSVLTRSCKFGQAHITETKSCV